MCFYIDDRHSVLLNATDFEAFLIFLQVQFSYKYKYKPKEGCLSSTSESYQD